MKRTATLLAAFALLFAISCSRKEAANQPTTSGQRAVVVTRDGTTTAGTVTASSAKEITLVGDDHITRTIPMDQVRSVDYGDTAAAPAAAAPAAPPAETAALPQPADRNLIPKTAIPEPRERPTARPAPSPVTTKTHELPVGAEVAVRTDETIDSAKAAEGQTFSGEVTRDVRDADGDVVIPRGAPVRIVIKSASKGGRFRGASDLVLDLQSVTIGGRAHSIETADIAQKGRQGVGANKRTGEFAGGGAALGAIIGAIAGGGKGAAIGAASGAGAGVATQVITKGGSIRVPAETVLTFKLDKPLRVTAVQ